MHSGRETVAFWPGMRKVQSQLTFTLISHTNIL